MAFSSKSNSPPAVWSSTLKTQNQVLEDKRPNPADSIKLMTPISHSAAFFHFFNKKKQKTELVLLSCGGLGTTRAALISARHSYTSAFAFDLSLSRLSPHQSGKNKKEEEKKEREKGKKCKMGRRASSGEERRRRLRPFKWNSAVRERQREKWAHLAWK